MMPSPRQVRWDEARQEVTLWQEAFRFSAAKSERPVAVEDRRGAARDQFGNWYWIAPDRHSILVCSSGSQTASTFWPVTEGETTPPVEDGSFRPAAPAVPTVMTLQGLTVTEDHYLVAGCIEGAHGFGLFIFDLYSGGPPRERVWPAPFEPFDLTAREGGGLWALDKEKHRLWEIDRRFDVVVRDPGPPLGPDGAWFKCADNGPDIPAPRPIQTKDGWLVAASDPIAVAALPGHGVVILERDGGDGFARVHWLKDGVAHGVPVSTRLMLDHVGDDVGTSPLTLIAHDFTFGDPVAGDPNEWIGRLYIVGVDGNQAFAFGVSLKGDQLVLHPRPEFFPMRLFGGKALVSAGGEPWYDCGETWVRLVGQDRPRYVEEGELWTPVFDSGEPGCVWHRLMLDACIPPGADVAVYSRASDDWRELTLIEWLDELERRAIGATDDPEPGTAVAEADLARWDLEPKPVQRRDGPELPFLRTNLGAGRSTFELLLQRARGRYLQVKLVLRGDGRSTPRIRALRVWYPRFSYLDRYLPAVYREDETGARFLDRFLANFEGIFTTIEDRIAAAQILFDVASAPPDALDWLGRWFGVALDPSWEDERRRLFIRHAVDFFAMRGTIRGLQVALRLAFDTCVDDRLFTDALRLARVKDPVRVIERFRARRPPPVLLGDVRTEVPRPQLVDPASRWSPRLGGADLQRRYREAFALPLNTEFPLTPTGAPDGWAEFAERALGFVPRAGAAERSRWLAFLQQRGVTGTTLPANEPGGQNWNDFLATPQRTRKLWQDFLARRYPTISALNAAWGKNWSRFSNVALHDRLPVDGAALTDWFQFEGTVLAMNRTAHRFTVMLPAPKRQRTDSPEQQRRLALARTVIDLEKPAHTTYDIRFYWAMFRLGEARLGDDTLIDLGSRSPELMGPMVLGQGYLSEAFLADRAGNRPLGRYELGRDRVGRSGQLGGP
jgi:phage tail-like protein